MAILINNEQYYFYDNGKLLLVTNYSYKIIGYNMAEVQVECIDEKTFNQTLEHITIDFFCSDPSINKTLLTYLEAREKYPEYFL